MEYRSSFTRRREERCSRPGLCAVLDEDLLHIDHVVPAAELAGAAAEGPDPGEAETPVEAFARVRQVFVLPDGVRDTGVEIHEARLSQPRLHRLVQAAAEAAAPCAGVEIDAPLAGARVGGAGLEGPGVGVAADETVLLQNEVGVAREGGADALGKLRLRRDGNLQRDGRVRHVVRVDPQQRGGVLRRGRADGHAAQGSASSLYRQP